MKMFKNLMLSMLIISCINSVAFGMNEQGLSFIEKIRGTIDSPFFSNALLDGFSALHVALRFGNAKIARLLIEAAPEEQRAAIVMKRSIHGFTPLHVAVLMSGNDIETVNFLLSVVPEEQRLDFVMARAENVMSKESKKETVTAFYLALIDKNIEMVKLMIEAVPVEQRAILAGVRYTEYGCTALYISAFEGDIGMVRMLLESVPAEQRAACIAVKDQGGHTVLHFVSLKGDLEMTRMLLESVPAEQRAACIMSKDREEHTALWYAERKGHRELAQILAEYCQIDAQEQADDESKKRSRDDGDGNSDAPKKRESKESESGCAIM